MQALSRDDLLQAYRLHKAWLDSGGVEGKRANFYEADSSKVNFRRKNFFRARFAKVDFWRADLRKIGFKRANLQDTSFLGLISPTHVSLEPVSEE